MVAEGYSDLAYLPRDRHGWDCTLAAVAYGCRRLIEAGPPDLAAWAARHGLPASERYHGLGPHALVLWHGTSRERADRIAEHGLFHKRGLWTTLNPMIAHGFCRSRSERFGTEGAVVCLVLDSRDHEEGHDYETEGAGDVMRFHRGLPPEVVEYALVHDEARFAAPSRARDPSPWPRARSRKRSGQWIPVQQPPVRYSDSLTYSSVEDFVALCVDRLLRELTRVTALEVFSTVYALVEPWAGLPHETVFGALEQACGPPLEKARVRTYRARAS